MKLHVPAVRTNNSKRFQAIPHLKGSILGRLLEKYCRVTRKPLVMSAGRTFAFNSRRVQLLAERLYVEHLESPSLSDPASREPKRAA